jgi:hypothetical protein
MKKFLTLLLILCIVGIFGNAFGQDKKTQEKKGGFAVGGYDNTRQEKSTVTKRSVDIPAEAAPAEKAMEVEEPAAVQPSQAPEPAPAATDAKPQREAQGNTSTKDKEKAKKNTRSKGKRR